MSDMYSKSLRGESRCGASHLGHQSLPDLAQSERDKLPRCMADTIYLIYLLTIESIVAENGNNFQCSVAPDTRQPKSPLQDRK